MILALRQTPASDAKWNDKLAHWAIKTRLVTNYREFGSDRAQTNSGFETFLIHNFGVPA